MGGIPGPLGASGCHGYGGNQNLRLNKEGQLAQGEWCLTPRGNKVTADHCVKGTVDGQWIYDQDTRQVMTKGRQCLTVDANSNDVKLSRCHSENKLQCNMCLFVAFIYD